MATSRNAILLILCSTLFTTAGQLLWKYGTMSSGIKIFPTALGFVSYVIAVVLMLLSFREGEVSVLYPFIAMSYILVSLLSPMLFPDETMNVFKWLGVGIILISVSLLGVRYNKNERTVIAGG